MTVRKNELRIKIEKKDKKSLIEDFKLLEQSIDIDLEMGERLIARLFTHQLRDYILEECE